MKLDVPKRQDHLGACQFGMRIMGRPGDPFYRQWIQLLHEAAEGNHWTFLGTSIALRTGWRP